MRKLLLSFSAVLALSLATVSAARADVYTYTFSGDVNGSFSLDSATSTTSFENGGYIREALFGGTGILSNTSSAYFINTSSIYTGDFQGPFTSFGVQFYSGSESSPTYLTGTFNLTNFTGGGPITLTVADGAVAATPEPSSLILLGTGVLGIFGAARRRFTA